jgi:DNA repair exonuclease SbcCD nuclease subunit
MKILSIADIHFGATDPKRMYNELQESFFPKITDDIDLIVILGDLFHKELSLSKEATFFMMKFINELKDLCHANSIYLRILKGTMSHDFSQLEMLKPLEDSDLMFRIISTVEIEEWDDGMKCLYIPEEYCENWKKYYTPFLEQRPDFILGHGTFDFTSFASQKQESELNIKSSPVFERDYILNYTKFVLFGHIHTHQYSKSVIYPGSFSRFSFGEENPKGFLLVEYLPDKFKFEFIENKHAPTYVTINLDKISSEGLEDKINVVKEISKKYDFVRVTQSEENVDFKILKESLASNGGASNNVTTLSKPLNENKTSQNDEFSFIINREGTLEEILQRFIKIKFSKEISIEEIKELLSPL